MLDGQLDDRVDVFLNSRLIDIAPTETAYVDRAYAWFKLGDTDAAMADWFEARRRNPLLWGPRSWIIHVHVTEKQDDSAIAEIADYLLHAPDDTNIGSLIADLYESRNGHRRTDRLSDLLMSRFPGDTRVFRKLRESFYDENNSESAARLAEDWLARYPGDTAAHWNRIIDWYVLDRHDEVIRAAEDMARIEPLLETWILKPYLATHGSAQAARGNVDRALGLYARLDRIDSAYSGAREGQWLAHLARGEFDSASLAYLRPLQGTSSWNHNATRAGITLRLAGHDAAADSVLRLARRSPYFDSTSARASRIDYFLGEIDETQYFHAMPDSDDLSAAMSYASIFRSWRGDREGARELMDSVISRGDTSLIAFRAADLILRKNLKPRRSSHAPPLIAGAIARIRTKPYPSDTDRIGELQAQLMSDSASRFATVLDLLALFDRTRALDSYVALDIAWRDSIAHSSIDTRAENLRLAVAWKLFQADRIEDAEALLAHVRRESGEAAELAGDLLRRHSLMGSLEGYDRLRARWGDSVTANFQERSIVHIRREPALLMSFVVWLAAVSGGSVLALLTYSRRRGVDRAMFPALLAAGSIFILQALLVLSSDQVHANTSWLLTIAAVIRDLLVVVSGIALARAAGTGIFRRPGRGISLAVAALAPVACIAWTLLLMALSPPRVSELMKWFETNPAGGELGILMSADTLTIPVALMLILAAIREEILCRGFFLPLIFLMIGGRRARWKATGAWGLASLAIGVLWALAHAGMVQPEWWKFLHVTGLAMVLGEVMRRHGLLATVLVHGTFNLLIVIVMNLLGRNFG
mgnify:FL=1